VFSGDDTFFVVVLNFLVDACVIRLLPGCNQPGWLENGVGAIFFYKRAFPALPKSHKNSNSGTNLALWFVKNKKMN